MTIQEAVASKIIGSGETIKETVIGALAQIEINSRVEIITKAISRQDELEKEYKKVNRDDVTTYVKGVPVNAMSDSRFKEVKKTEDGLTKLTKAIDEALELNTSDSYKKLSELLK